MAGTKRKAPAEGASPSKKAHVSPVDTPASGPASTIFTEAPSAAETSMTSRSSKRPKRYVCEHEACGKAFDRPVRLEAHVRSHTGDRPFVCEEADCDKSFFKAEHLKAHVQNKHTESADHKCTYVLSTDEDGTEVECGKTFTTGTRLRRHVAAHEAKEETKCKEPGCGLVFRKMETLQRHVLQDHMHEKAFRCTQILSEEDDDRLEEVCGQTFSSLGQLKAHESREHAGLQHFCPVCTASTTTSDAVGFRTYAELQAHTKDIHPPTCDLCQQTFPSSRALTAHLEIEHSSLASRQKFRCDYHGCDRGFTRQGNLKVHHQTVHVKAKNFMCGQFDLSGSKHVPDWDGHGCGLGFGTKAALESHVRTQHLHLPALSGSQQKKVKSEDVSEVSTPMYFEAMPDQVNSEMAGALSMLTGTGYETERPLECFEAGSGCPHRFSRDYDLGLHMETAHGWTEEQINERFLERQALRGEDFWVGGEAYEDEEEDRYVGLDSSEEALRRQLEDALRINNAQHTPNNGLADFLAYDGKEMSVMENGQLMPAIREEEMAVDPALI